MKTVKILRLFRSHELVEVRRPIFVITFVAHDSCKTFLNELLSNVAEITYLVSSNKRRNDNPLLSLVAVTNGSTFTFLVFTFSWANKVDVNLDILSDEFLTKKLACIVGKRSLTWVR